MSGYADLFKDLTTARSKQLHYAGKKFIITRVTDDTINGMLGKEGLVLEKSNTLIIVAHCNEKYAPNLASGKADQVVKMLRDQNL